MLCEGRRASRGAKIDIEPPSLFEREVPPETAPFDEIEAEEVGRRLEELAKIGDKDPTEVRERWWPILRRHAEECRRRMIDDELRKPADKHVWQRLQRIAERGSLGRGFPNAGNVGSNDDITVSALRHGASSEGLSDNLEQLSQTEIQAAARSALASSMIRDSLGRPDRGPLLDYAKALAG